MSGQRRRCDLLSHWATVELCEAQAAHRGSGMGDLGFPSPPAEVKLGAEPGCGGLCHVVVLLWAARGVWRGVARRGTAWLRPGSGSRPTWAALVKPNSHHRCFIPKLF